MGLASRAAVSLIVRTRNYLSASESRCAHRRGGIGLNRREAASETETTDVLKHETLAGALRCFL